MGQSAPEEHGSCKDLTDEFGEERGIVKRAEDFAILTDGITRAWQWFADTRGMTEQAKVFAVAVRPPKKSQHFESKAVASPVLRVSKIVAHCVTEP